MRTLHAVVVDDDRSQADGIACQLRQLGFACDAFDQWERAQEAIESSPALDLLLTDNVLKQNKSGIAFVAALLAHARTVPRKIVIVTGSANALTNPDEAAARKWGMLVESKPVDVHRLVRRLFPNMRFRPDSEATWPARAFSLLFGSRAVRIATVIGALAALLALLPVFGWLPDKDHGKLAVAAPSVKVRLAINPVPMAALPIVAARGKFWEKAGLNVELISFPSGKASLDAALSGSAEFATAAETPVMRAGLAGLQPAVLATIASSPLDCKVTYRRDHGIRQPTDLRGKKIATAFGTSAEYFMDTFLRHYGIRRDEVTAISMRPSEMVEAFARGDISAFFMWEPYDLYALRLVSGNGGVFTSDGLYTETFHIVARRAYAETNPETIRRLLQGLLEAEHSVEAARDLSAAQIAEYSQIRPEDMKLIWEDFRFRVELDGQLPALLASEAKWARESDPTLVANMEFHTLVWPEPLRELDGTRVSNVP